MNAIKNRLLQALCMIVLSVWCCSVFAALKAKVDRNTISINESFTLTVQTGDSVSDDPDFSVLNHDFEILHTGKSSSMQIVNGNVSRNTSWQVSLMARRSGQLQIPSIAVDNQASEPIDLQVEERKQGADPQGNRESTEDMILELRAEPQVAYPQQQVILTVRLYYNTNFSHGNINPPTFPKNDGEVKQIGKDHTFETQRYGQTYEVAEVQYAFTPQKSGKIVSTAASFDCDVPNDGGGMFPFGPIAEHHQRIHSNSVTLDVKPIPAPYTADQWLPSSKLELKEQWSADPATFSAGEPITRTLEIRATGLTASQLPSLAEGPTPEGFKVYPDKAQTGDEFEDNVGVGVRSQKIAYIPTKPGKITLPAIEVKWWNTATGKEQTSSLPARTFTVLPPKQDVGSAPTPAATDAASSSAPSGTDGTSINDAHPQRHLSGAWLLSLCLACGWAISMLLMRRSRRRNTSTNTVTPPKENKAGITRQLKESCNANDAAHTKTLLLGWAKLQWPQDPPVSLIALARRCPPELAEALLQLDHALYAKTQHDWQGGMLWQAFHAKAKEKEKKNSGKNHGLDPLYPS